MHPVPAKLGVPKLWAKIFNENKTERIIKDDFNINFSPFF
jgi:hypothetical protein